MFEQIKRNIFIILSILLLFTIQTGVLENISLGGIVPNLLLIFIVAMGVINNEYVGMAIGFISGLIIDIFFMDIIGYHALVYVYVGYVSGWMHRYFIPQDFKLPLIMVGSCDLISSVIYYLLFFLLNGRFDFGYYFVHIILAELIYTLGIWVILYPLIMLIEYKVIRKTFWRKEKDAG